MKNTGAVYFRPEDHASFWRRVLVDLVDMIVFFVPWFCGMVMILMVTASNRAAIGYLFGWTAVLAFCYFVLLKRSRFRTPGYRLGRVRIVGMDGQTPSILALSMRLTFLPVGPLNWAIDYIWLAGDAQRQSIRDKLTQTYVVQADAQPAGSAEPVYRYYDILGYSLLVRELMISVPSASSRNDHPAGTSVVAP